MSVYTVIKDYTLFKSIGKGAFGEVYLTLKEGNSELFATKMINLQKIKDPKILKYLSNEVLIMKELNHPNIIKFKEFIRTNNYYYVVMEYCNGGSLLDLLIKYKKKYRKPFSIKIIQYFMRQIVEGIAYIHSQNIIHRDIKLANILVKFPNISEKNQIDIIDINNLDESDFLSSQIKIIDFGFSKKSDENETPKTLVGTPINMAPTILKKYKKEDIIEQLKEYDEKVDIWSLGTICYEMLTGHSLFRVKSLIKLIEKVQKKNYSIRVDIELSNEVISFLNSMLQYNGQLRASAKDLLEHDFLTKDQKNFIKVNDTDLFNQNEVVMKKYIECLSNDYKTAKEYFKINNLKEQEKDAYNKYLQIENIKSKINAGNKIYLTDLPKQIEPEYIYGCSEIERNNKFNEILSKHRAEKNILEVKLKSLLKKHFLKQIDNDEYEKDKKNYEKLKYIIEQFENQFKNIWVPPPKYKKQMKQIINEKICYDKCEFKIKIQIKIIDNNNETLDLNVSFLVNEFKTLKKNIELKVDNYYYEEWIWILNANEWMNVDNNFDNFILDIEINKSGNEKQTITINVNKIRNGERITFSQELSNNTEKIKIIVEPILPKGEKIKYVELKEIISIKNVYPPFEWKNYDIYDFPIYMGINN